VLDTDGWWSCRARGGVEKEMLRQRQSWWCTRHHASKQGLAVSDHGESTTAAVHTPTSRLRRMSGRCFDAVVSLESRML
jgi:hypothetical protein